MWLTRLLPHPPLLPLHSQLLPIPPVQLLQLHLPHPQLFPLHGRRAAAFLLHLLLLSPSRDGQAARQSCQLWCAIHQRGLLHDHHTWEFALQAAQLHTRNKTASISDDCVRFRDASEQGDMEMRYDLSMQAFTGTVTVFLIYRRNSRTIATCRPCGSC